MLRRYATHVSDEQPIAAVDKGVSAASAEAAETPLSAAAKIRKYFNNNIVNMLLTYLYRMDRQRNSMFAVLSQPH